MLVCADAITPFVHEDNRRDTFLLDFFTHVTYETVAWNDKINHYSTLINSTSKTNAILGPIKFPVLCSP